MTYYATLDADGEHIHENAHIEAFTTYDAMLEWLAEAYSNLKTIKPVKGQFGDCWKKRREIYGPGDFEPFDPDDIHLAPSGTHPGGSVYWITPRVAVYVVGEK